MSEPTDSGPEGLPWLQRISFGIIALVVGIPSGLFMFRLLDGMEVAGILCTILLMSFGIGLSFANQARYQLWGALLFGFAIGTLPGPLVIMWILKRLPSS